jgi:hypothetical protein
MFILCIDAVGAIIKENLENRPGQELLSPFPPQNPPSLKLRREKRCVRVSFVQIPASPNACFTLLFDGKNSFKHAQRTIQRRHLHASFSSPIVCHFNLFKCLKNRFDLSLVPWQELTIIGQIGVG